MGLFFTTVVELSVLPAAVRTKICLLYTSNPSPAADLLTYTNYRDGKPYGVVEGPKRKDGTRTLGTAVELKSVDNVRSDAFDMDEMTLTLPSMVLPIADNVQCYNKATETWFAVGEKASDEDYKNALNLARAYSGTLTVYYEDVYKRQVEHRLMNDTSYRTLKRTLRNCHCFVITLPEERGTIA